MHCGPKAKTQNSSETNGNTRKADSIYGKKLIDSDSLKYADASKMERLKIQLKCSFDIYDVRNFKIAQIDAEELAEFNFDFFLPQINRILEKRKVNLTVKNGGRLKKNKWPDNHRRKNKSLS